MGASHWYMVRAGRRGAEIIEDFLKEECVAVGFTSADLTNCTDKASIRALVELDDPKRPKQKIEAAASQLHRFRNVFTQGDTVVTFDSNARVYHVGTITGDYRFWPDSSLKHGRAVKWQGVVSRDALSVSARNTLGAIATIFAIDSAAQSELESRLAAPASVPAKLSEKIEEDVEQYFEETERRAEELIADAFDAIAAEEMVEVVDALLRVTGYHTRRGDKGADRGVDLYASPDPWMVKSPRIKVQVKHRDSSMGGPEIRNFIGTLQDGDTGIYVSTGGFTKDGRYEADRSSRPLSLIDRNALIALYLEHYDELDEDIRAVVPVKRVYLPVKVGRE